MASITIPGKVTSIGDYAFSECTGLINITFSNGITTIGGGVGICYKCSNLKNVIIGIDITDIKNGAFAECNNITDIYYAGTLEQWGAINFNQGNNSLTDSSVTVHYNASVP